jgi:DNA-binding MarR family transcriptional regulator
MTKERAVKNGHEDVTTLERVLQLHGQFRRNLEPLRVTPLQAAVLLFLLRHPESKISQIADALVLRVPTEAVGD